jgi:energy-coupling factor transporter ATP-binding protein EcfA2
MNDWKDSGNQSQSMNNTLTSVSFGNGVNNFTFAPSQIIQISADKIKLDKLNPISPYRGLKPFENDEFDSNLFFGRDQLILRLMQNLNSNDRNLVLLLGASGSGKSSVIKAGLIPQLRKSLGKKFCEIIFKPDRDPFLSLFAALLGKVGDQSKASIALSGQTKTLVEIVSTLNKPEDYWLIYIDQFEELFTSSEPDKRDNFIQGLGLLYKSLRESQSQSVKIVMTMRADFLDRFDPFPVLGEITRGNIELITTMYEDELRQAIEQPAAKHGVVFEDGLVKKVIEDIKGQSGSLPLLQYTLDLLWKRDNIADPNDLTKPHPHENRSLYEKTYGSFGGVRGALQSHIEEVYTQKLKTSAQQDATKQIFLKLVQWISGEGGQYISVSRRRLRSDFEIGIEVETLDIFIDERLIVSNVDNLSQTALQDGLDNKQEATVEIAHEVLISAWERLKEWIGEAKDVLIAKSQLQADMARYKDVFKNNQAKANDELLVGSRLEKVLELWDDGMFELRNIPLESEEIKFIEKSIEWRDRQIREKEKQLYELNLAVTESLLQEQSRKVLERLSVRPTDALILSIHCLGLNLTIKPHKILSSVKSCLYRALNDSRERLYIKGNQDSIVHSVDFSKDEKSIISVDNNGIYTWDLKGEMIKKDYMNVMIQTNLQQSLYP